MKKPLIFPINKNRDNLTRNSAQDELKELAKLLKRKKYNEIITRARLAREMYPDNYFFHNIDAIAQSMLGNAEQALSIMKQAAIKFPGEYDVHYQLGRIYKELGEFDSALKSINDSIQLTPVNYIEARSECYNELGIIYWDMMQKDNALDNWKLAIMENPKNLEAQHNLREFTNEFDEPVMVSPVMDDLFHFQKVQFDKYLEIQGIKELRDQKDLEKIINLILYKWNEVIAPQKIKLDTFTPKEKTNWFKSIKIDFDTKKVPQILNNSVNENVPTTINEYTEDEKGLIPFALPLLSAKKITVERMEKLFLNNNILTKRELEIVDWALVVVDTLFKSQSIKLNKIESEDLILEAIEVAFEELDFEVAEEVVNKILNAIKTAIKNEKRAKKKK